MLQYLPLEKGGQAETRAEKQSMSPESSQIGAIQIWRKKCRSVNPSLGMQEKLRGLLEILKGHRDLQGPAPKTGGDNLNNFRSDLNPSEGFFESLKDVSKREIKSKDFSKDFNENQLEVEWA